MKKRESKIPPGDRPRVDETIERLIQLAKVTEKKQAEAKWQAELDTRKKSSQQLWVEAANAGSTLDCSRPPSG